MVELTPYAKKILEERPEEVEALREAQKRRKKVEIEPPPIIEEPELLPPVELPPEPVEPTSILERIYPEMFRPEATFGYKPEEIPGAVALTIETFATEEPEAFLEDLISRGRTPDTEALLAAFGATPEDVEEIFAPPKPFEIPEGGVQFVEEDIITGLRTLYTLNQDYTVETNGKTIGIYKPETGNIVELSMAETMIVTIDDVRQLVTITPEGKAFNDKGQWVGTYNRAAGQFTVAKTDEGWFEDNIIDPWNFAANRLGHGLTQFGSGVLANILFRDLGDIERNVYGDDWVDRVNAGNQVLRDKFRIVHALNQKDFDDWVVKHPELIPKPKYEEGLSEHPELLLDPGYFAYEFFSTAPISLPIMAIIAGGVATGTLPLAIAGSMAIMTPAESADAYEALIDAGAPENEAAPWALFVGTCAGLIETFSDVLFLKVIAAPIVGLFRKAVVEGMAKATIAYLLKKGAFNYTATTAIEVAEEVLTLAISNAVLKVYDENKGIWDDMIRTAAKTFAAVSPIAVVTGASTMIGISRQQAGQFTDAEKIKNGWQQDPASKDWFRPMTPEEITAKLVEGGVIEEVAPIPEVPEVVPTPVTPEVTGNILPVEEVSKLETRIPLDLIRKDESAEIARLTDEIRLEGVKEPITIRVRGDGSQVVWDGIHRLIVAQDLGIKNIPVKYIGEEGLPAKKPPTKPKPPITPEVVEAPERIVYTEGGFPVSPEETIPQGVADNIPTLQDIGAKERIARPTRKVFERMGLYETYKGIQRGEVLVGEEQVAFIKEVGAVAKTVSKNKERWELIFDEANESGSVVGLTFSEKRAVNFIRKWANEWAERKNLPQEKRIKDYIPHLFEQEMIGQWKETGRIPAEMASILSEKVPKKITDPFLKQRLGAVGFMKDPFHAMVVYNKVASRVLHYEPFLQKIATIANDPKQTGTVRRYLKDFSRRMTSEPSKIDLDINKDLLELAKKLQRLPGGETLANFLSRGNPSGWSAYNFTSAIYTLWLGFKPTSAIRNLSQHTLIIGEVGPVHFADGIRMRFTKEGKQALTESLVLRSRKAAFVPGIDDSFATQWVDKFRETALWMFRMADKQNVSDAFLAGYSEAKQLLPNADRQVWIDRGDEVAADTQYLYTKMNSMAISQSAPGRVFSILTTWMENWIELMSKWIARRPSQVYLQHERATGEKVTGANWSTSYKAILIYMVIIGLGFAIKEKTRLKAWEYTGLTSIRYLADIAGGDFPGLQYIGAAANLIAGFVTDDERRLKEGLNQLNPVKMAGILRQLDDVASGDKDWLTLLLYLEGRDWKIKQLKDKWEKDFKAYPLFKDKDGEYDPELFREYIRTHPKQAGWSEAKIRNQWRIDNPLIEAKMFVVSQFTTLSTDKARAEVLRLIEEHKLDPELIDGYEKVFGVDTDEELTKFKNRIGNLEKFVVGEEAEYFTVGNFVSEVNRLVKIQGRTKVDQDGSPFTLEILRAQDSFVQYDAIEGVDGRKLFRQQFPDIEALLYLTGKVQSFENPKSAEILLGLMKKYDIPPEGIRAFVDKPERYDELFTQKFELEQKSFDLNTEYENYGNTESPLYIEDSEARKEAREKLKLNNPDWVADMRRIEAIDNDASPEIIEKWAERGKTIDEFSAGSSEAKVWLLDNPDTFKWALDNELLTDDGSDWNVPVLRINAQWRVQDEEYDALPVEGDDRVNYLVNNEDYRKDRRRREAYSDGFAEDQIENFVGYHELPVKGFWQERYLLDNPEFADAMHNIKGIDLPKPQDVPSVQYDKIYDEFKDDFDKLDGLSDHESPLYIEDTDARDKAREAMRFKDGKLTDFGVAEIRREAYGKLVPDKHIESYVGYYSIIAEGKPEAQELWYEDDWFMMEHKDFYKDVYLGILGNERKDYRLVPTRKVFDKYQRYLDLPQGKRRDDYRWGNPDLDAWLVEKFGYTPMTEQKLREELTPTEEFLEEIAEREKEFKESLKEIEEKLRELG